MSDIGKSQGRINVRSSGHFAFFFDAGKHVFDFFGDIAGCNPMGVMNHGRCFERE